MARMMLVQAAANAWNVPVAECSAANSVITQQGVEPHRHLTARWPKPPASSISQRRAAERPEGLEDRRQATQAARHCGQDRRQDVYGIDIASPNSCTPRSPPVRVRRQAAKL